MSVPNLFESGGMLCRPFTENRQLTKTRRSAHAARHGNKHQQHEEKDGGHAKVEGVGVVLLGRVQLGLARMVQLNGGLQQAQVEHGAGGQSGWGCC